MFWPPCPDEAFADEDGGGDLVEPFQFARGIDDEAIVRLGGLFELRSDLGAKDEFDLLALGEVHDFAGALDVSRDKDQEQAREFCPQIREDVEQYFLLAGMGAAGHEDRLRGRDADLLEQLDGIDLLRVGMGHGDVVLHVAGHVDAVGRHANGLRNWRRPPGFARRPARVVEDLAGEPAKPLVAPLGTGGHAAVDQKERHAARAPPSRCGSATIRIP